MYLQKGEIITIASGHYPLQGAVGYGNETQLAKAQAELLVKMFNNKGYRAYKCTPPNGSYSINSQLQKEVALANSYNAKLHLCLHFNAGGGAGHECWIYATGGSAEQFARQIVSQVVKDCGFKNRGVKVSGNSLYIPKKTNAPCVLIETCFVDSKSDIETYNLEKTCKAIFKAVTGADYDGIVPNSNTNNNATTTTGMKLEGYNATVKNDFFYTRDINGNKDGGRVDIGDQIKILSLINNKQLLYVEYPVSGGTKKAYIANDCSCISFRYEGQWKNGSTPEKVFSDSNLRDEVGSLDPRESATPLFSENGKLYLIYDTSKGTKTKAGFVEYLAGFNF